MIPTDIAVHLRGFLGDYLPGQQNLSSNTIRSYADTFKLLLQYCRDTREYAIERLYMKNIDQSLVEDFLAWLETERACSISTRNQRLAALHTFFRYVQAEAPEFILHCQRVLAIPFKRHQRAVISYLSAVEMQAVLSQPDQSGQKGRRDLVLLSLLYDSGARVQELIDLIVRDVRLEHPAKIMLTGKGRKTRYVPLMPRTVALLESHLREQHLNAPLMMDYPLFFNSQRKELSRAGVTYIVGKYADMARNVCHSIPNKVTPHTFRHSKAMHLLQANVSLVYIRDIFGHTDIKTTEIYARADTEMKRLALEQLSQQHIPEATTPWQQDTGLLAWLSDLCRKQ